MTRAGDARSAAPFIVALDVFEHLGATFDATASRSFCRQHRVPLPKPSRGGSRGRYGSRLSPRESAVVELVAAGRSTTEISDILFLSPKTVARHVSSAMHKLGVRTRVALVSRWLTESRGD